MIRGLPVSWLGYDESSGRGIWCVDKDFIFYNYKVDAGFVTDGGSIPTIFNGFIQPTGVIFPASIIHDVLYTTHEMSRLKADIMLYKMFRECGLSVFKSCVAFLAVRACGGGKSSWDAPGPTTSTAVFNGGITLC